MSICLPYPEVKAVIEPAQKLLVFIHGLGSDGHDLIGLVPFMQKELPEYHFISPHGTEPFDMAPFGRQWFSLSDRNPATISSVITVNIPLLAKIISDKQKELNLCNKDTVILGFSQGTMMGLYLTLIQDEPYYAMIGFSGRIIPPPICKNSSTPICLIHGENDEIVEISEMDNCIKYLDSNNLKTTTLRIPNLSHSIDSKGIEFAIKFIKNIGV